MGYHIESLLSSLKLWRNPEFIEYAVHHMATVGLISISYYFSYSDIGVVIFLLHDASDVITPLLKALGDLRFKIRYAVYVLQLISWFYFRLYVLSLVLFESWRVFPMGAAGFHGLQNIMATILLFLHIFWYNLMLKIGFNIIFKNDDRDVTVSYGTNKGKEAQKITKTE